MHWAPVDERAHRVTLSDRSGEFLRAAAAGAGGVGGEKTMQQIVQVHGALLSSIYSSIFFSYSLEQL
jgi:hypothetical protein